MTARGVGLGLLVLYCLSAVWQDAARAQDASPGPGAEGDAGSVPGIHIHRVNVSLKDDVYYLDAEVDFEMGRHVLEALDQGVSIPLIVTIEILRERQYLWDETIATLEQRYELDYHSLTRQYMIRNINIGTQAAYPSRTAALAALGRIADLPVIDANLLDPEESYDGRVRVRIDTNALPVPLRLRALVSPEWRLSSDWHAWRF